MTQTIKPDAPIILSLADRDTANFIGTQDAGVDPDGVQAVVFIRDGQAQIRTGEVRQADIEAALAARSDVLLMLAHEDGAHVTVDESVLVMFSPTRAAYARERAGTPAFAEWYGALAREALARYLQVN